MIAQIVVQALIYIGVFLLSEALRPRPEIENAKAAAFDEFSIPDNDPERPVPVVFGRVRITSPTIVWYGDYSTFAVDREVRSSIFNTDEMIIGYHYFIGLQLGLARALDYLETFLWNDEVLVQFSPRLAVSTVFNVDLKDFLGGAEPGGQLSGGGVVGQFAWYTGGAGQAQDPYLAAHQNPCPNYRHLSHLVFRHVRVGTQPKIDPLAFIGARYPNTLGLSGGRHIVGRAANPMAVVYELLTNDDYGLTIAAADVNAQQFRNVGDLLHAEGLGFSLMWVKVTEVRELIKEIERQCDVSVYLDFATGKWTVLAIREDGIASPVLPIPVLNESNITKLENFSRGNWSKTANHIVVRWKDPDSPQSPSPAVEDDMANFRIQGRSVEAVFDFPGIDNKETAQKVAARARRTLAYPLAKCTLVTNSDAIALRPGMMFDWVYPSKNIVSMRMRVVQISIGDSSKTQCRIDAIQDIFSVAKAVYAPPNATLWTDPALAEPTETLFDKAFEAPLFLDRLSPLTSPVVASSVQDSRIMLAPVPTHLNVTGFRMMQNTAPATSPADLVVADFGNLALRGTTTHAITAAQYLTTTSPLGTLTVTGVANASALVSATAAEIRDALANLFLVDDEFFAFESMTLLANGDVRLGGIHRAKLDTVPVAHSLGAPVFFLGYGTTYGGGITTLRPTTAGVVSARPNTTKGILDEALDNEIAYTPTNRIFKPYRPANLRYAVPTASPQIGATYYPAALPRLDWVITWDIRDRRELADVDVNTNTSQAVEPSTEVVLEFWRGSVSPNTLQRTVVLSPLTGETFTYTVAMQDADAGGAGSLPIRVKLYSRRTAAPLSGLASHTRWDHVIQRG